MKILFPVAALFFAFSFCKSKKCQETTGGNCICTMQYDPVCGCNNKTYANDCEAECRGIKKYTKGECPK